MAEWSNAAVLKTVVRLPADRGFESLFLRNKNSPGVPGLFCFCLRQSGKLRPELS